MYLSGVRKTGDHKLEYMGITSVSTDREIFQILYENNIPFSSSTSGIQAFIAGELINVKQDI